MEKKKERKSNFTEGPATQELAELIPIENIKVYTCLYRLIDGISTTDLRHFDYAAMARENQLYSKKVDRLGNALTKNQRELEHKLHLSRLGGIVRKNLFEAVVKQGLHKKGKPIDYAFNILLFTLSFDLRYYKRKPSNVKIANFLSEQRIKFLSDADVGIAVRRAKKLPIGLALILFGLLSLNEQNENENIVASAIIAADVKGIYPGFLTEFLKRSEACNFKIAT